MSSFHSSKRFDPVQYFPYGLARSGEFNRRQVRLLEIHGEAYSQLDNGDVAPKNATEKRFVQVCEGRRLPESEHERVWMVYRRKVASQVVVSPFGSHLSKQNFTDSSVMASVDLEAL